MPRRLRASSTHLGPCVQRCARFLRCTELSATGPQPRPSPHPSATRLAGEGVLASPLLWAGRRVRAAGAHCFPESGLARSVRGPPRRRQAEPTGALGQLPPRTRNSLLLLLENPSERVYIEPYKLPARAFTIYEKSEPALGKWGHRGCGAK